MTDISKMTEKDLCFMFDHRISASSVRKPKSMDSGWLRSTLSIQLCAVRSSAVQTWREMRTIADICRSAGVISKVIFENCYLEKQEIEHLAKIALIAKPDFIKTSTGFGTGGATVEDVALMKQTVGDAVQVKAAGGIRSWETCKAMIEAGATRIGCSAGIQILKEFREAAK